MKKLSFKVILLAIMAIFSSTLLTSCIDGDDNWPYSPPPGWGNNFFYDSDLNGMWQLVQSNGYPVNGYATNYMEFYGNGRGRYYYYDYGRLYREDMAYFCQMSGNTSTNYLVNVQYADGNTSTMTYWFTDNYQTLWLQWQTAGRTETYLYARTNGIY